jgi:hypothetical protein
MSKQIQLPSFFLPYVEVNISDNDIKRVFEFHYDFGKISFIDRIQKMDSNGYVYFWVYIHFQCFNWDDRTFDFVRDSKNFKNPPRVYCVQNYPKKFWKVLFNNATRKPSMPEIKISHRIPNVSQDCSHFPHFPPSVPKIEEPTKSKFQFVPRSIQMKKKIPRTSHVAEGKIGKLVEQEDINEEG